MPDVGIPFGFALQFKIYEQRLVMLGLRITSVITQYRLVESTDTQLYNMQTVESSPGESLEHNTVYTVMTEPPLPGMDFEHGSMVDIVMRIIVTNGVDTKNYETLVPNIPLISTKVIDLDLPIDHPLAIPSHQENVLVANVFATGNPFHRVEETTTLNDTLYTQDDTIYDLVNFTRLSMFDVTVTDPGYYLIDCTMLLRKTSEDTVGGVSHQLMLNLLQSEDEGSTWNVLRTKIFSTLEEELNQGMTLGTTNSMYFVLEKTSDSTVAMILRPEIRLESTGNANWGWATFGYIMNDYSHLRALQLKPGSKVLNLYANLDIVSTDSYQVLPWDESESLSSSGVYNVSNDAVTISEQGCYLVIMNLGILRRTVTEVDTHYLVDFAIHKNGDPISKSERGLSINKHIGTTVSSIFVDCFEADDVIDARVRASAEVDVDFRDSMSDLIVLKLDEEFSNISQMTVTNHMVLDAANTVNSPMFLEWTQDADVSSEFYELLSSSKAVKCNAHGLHYVMLSLGPELASDRNSMSLVYVIYKNGIEEKRFAASSRASYQPSSLVAALTLRYGDIISVGMYYIHNTMYNSAMPCNVKADWTMILMCDESRMGSNIKITIDSILATEGVLTKSDIAVNTYATKTSEQSFEEMWIFGMLNNGTTMTNTELEQLADSIGATTASCEYVTSGPLPYTTSEVVLTEAFDDSTLATTATVTTANQYDSYLLCRQTYDKDTTPVEQNVFHVQITTPSETIDRSWQQGVTDISDPDPDPGPGPAPPPAVVDFYGNKSLGDLTVSTDMSTMNKFSGVDPNVTSAYIANSVMIDLVNVADFAVGDLILLIQVQGINNYGQWELNRIINIAGSTATLDKPLKYTYTYEDESTALRYQVVNVPQYDQLTIDAGGVVSSAAYDGVTGGGVLAIAAETLIINGGLLTMSGKGYRGAYNNRPRNQNLWASGGMAGHNGSVGEGYAGKYVENWLQFAHNDTATHFMYSRSGNYGGGAGGGGGILDNGYQGVSSGHGGDHNHASSDINVKLTMGGGGGGGGTHDIEGLVDAGEGGGIILLVANNIQLLGGSIEAKGGDAVVSTSGFWGGHGGGAGGSIHLFANSTTDAVTTVNLSGGAGSIVPASTLGTHEHVGDVHGKPGSSGVINTLTRLTEPPILTGGVYKYTTNSWKDGMLYKKYNILTRNDQLMLASEVSSDLVVSYSGGMFYGWDKLPGIFMEHDARYLTAGDFPRVADTEIVIDLSWGTGDAWDADQGYFVAEFGINRGNTARYKPNLTISDESGNNAISFTLPQPTGQYEIFKVNKVYKKMKIAINGTNYNNYHYVYKIGVYGKTEPVSAFDMRKASAYTGGIDTEWPVTYVNGVQRLAPVLNTFAQFRRYTFEDKLVTSLGAVYTYFQMVRGEFHEYGVSFGFDSIYDDTATNVVAGVGQSPFLRIKMNEGDNKIESWWHSAAFTHGGSTEAAGGAGTHWEGDDTLTLHTNSTRVPNWNEDVRYFRIEAVDREIIEASSVYVGTIKRDLRFSMYNSATNRESGMNYRGWKYISQMTNISNIDAVLDEIATGAISFSAWQIQYNNWDEPTYYENVIRAYHLESNIGYL